MKWLPMAVVIQLAFLQTGVAENPVAQVIKMLENLQKKVKAEQENGEDLHKTAAELSSTKIQELSDEITTQSTAKEEATAVIAKEAALIATTKDELAEIQTSSSGNQEQLTAATATREQERGTFTVAEQELVGIVNALEKAIETLKQQVPSSGASLVQFQNSGGVLEALQLLVSGFSFSESDAQTLTGLVEETESPAETGAPAAVYENHSGDVISTLENLHKTATTNLENLRKTEIAAQKAFEELKASLEGAITGEASAKVNALENLREADQLKNATETKKMEAEEHLAAAGSNLDTTQDEQANELEAFNQEHEAETEEMKALRKATLILKTKMGSRNIVYVDQPDFQQLDEEEEDDAETDFLQVRSESPVALATRLVQKVAKETQSDEMKQLSESLMQVLDTHKSGEKPTHMVRNLIKKLIDQLVAKASAETEQKTYCDKEMHTNQEQTKAKSELRKQKKSEVDVEEANVKELMVKVANMEEDMVALELQQERSTALREAQKKQYEQELPQVQEGLHSVRLASKMLKDYYKGGTHMESKLVLNTLQTIESDFVRSETVMKSDAETRKSDYQESSKNYAIAKASKTTDLTHYKSEIDRIQQSATQFLDDLDTYKQEIESLVEYRKQLMEQCFPKLDPYEMREKNRQKEIAGLKNALEVLRAKNAPASFLQVHRF